MAGQKKIPSEILVPVQPLAANGMVDEAMLFYLIGNCDFL